jgi:hypothetical protein
MFRSALFWDITTRRRVTSQKSTDLINMATEAWNNRKKMYIVFGMGSELLRII